MLALRYAALLALVVWVGGLVVLGGVVAPAMFDVLGASGAAGRVSAGAVFSSVLGRFHLVSYGCGGVVIASLVARAVLGPRPRRFAIRVAIAAAMLAASGWFGFVVAPQVARVQAEIGGLPSNLPEQDNRRETFVRLHRLSTTLELVPFIGGLALLFWELRD